MWTLKEIGIMKLSDLTPIVVGLALALGSVADVRAEGATIKGKVNWDGKPYKGKPYKMKAECKKLHDGKPPRTEKVTTNKNGTVKNVFLYIKNAPKGDYPVPTEAVVLDQKGCKYIPHVFGVRVKQDIEVRNSDPVAHNIHAVPKKNKEFNRSQPKQNLKFKEKFKRAEIGLKFKCDVHPWMKAWAHVMDHPFFATTGDEGTFSITGLPAGTYTLVAWHEKYGTQEMEVTVAQDETKEADFTYSRATGKSK
jgi:plastocyanin